MDVQREYPQTHSSTEIVSALADFARLVQQMLVASTHGTLEAGATLLLKRLLDLWSMEQGALLLATHSHATSKQSFWRSLSERNMSRVLAKHDLDNDDLFLLLATCSGDEDIQVSSSEPNWVVCQQLLPVPGSPHQDVPLFTESFPAS